MRTDQRKRGRLAPLVFEVKVGMREREREKECSLFVGARMSVIVVGT